MSFADGIELMEQTARYSVLTMDAGHNVFELRRNEYIRYRRSNLPDGASLGWLQEDLQNASGITLARWFGSREDFNPNWVSFRHGKPNNLAEYEKLFRCPMHFNASETAMSFDPEYVRLPLPHVDPQLNRVRDDLCSPLLTQLGDAVEPAWLSIARRTALESFRHGVPDIKIVAAATGLAEAQLNERLAERGLSFRGFIDDLRQAMAVGYMRNHGFTLVDVAYLLGFSEQGSFQRAFKRWIGKTPGDYRRNLDSL